MREDVKQFDGVGDSPCVGAMGVVCESVEEGNDDVLDIDCLLHVGTRLQEQVQCLQVELIWEHLPCVCVEGGRERDILYPTDVSQPCSNEKHRAT